MVKHPESSKHGKQLPPSAVTRGRWKEVAWRSCPVGTGNLNGEPTSSDISLYSHLHTAIGWTQLESSQWEPREMWTEGVSLPHAEKRSGKGWKWRAKRITSIKLISGGVSRALSRAWQLTKHKRCWRNKNPLVRCELSAINIALLRKQDEHEFSICLQVFHCGGPHPHTGSQGQKSWRVCGRTQIREDTCITSFTDRGTQDVSGEICRLEKYLETNRRTQQRGCWRAGRINQLDLLGGAAGDGLRRSKLWDT